ncbi:MAG: hypothetical protein MRY72_07290 [Aquisalinus sp.]|nr:hypothetical protein [Aquisalinus sp.]
MKKILTLIGFFTITGLARMFLVAVVGGFLFLRGATVIRLQNLLPKR